MIDSLNEFVRGDVLENDNAYHCEECDKKVALLGSFLMLYSGSGSETADNQKFA